VEPVPAFLARKMGTHLITQTLERRPELGLESYDRFFPSQDTLPRGGLGNLIALPLQKRPRENSNSVFLDERFEPHADQWAFLSSIQRMKRPEIDALVARAENSGDLLGVRLPVEDEHDETPWLQLPSKRQRELPITGLLPGKIELVLANQVYVPKENLPPVLRNRLIRMAAFQNPEFYKAQAMRFSTFGKPRIISCCEEFPQHLALPRGCLDEVVDLLRSLDIEVAVNDERHQDILIEVAFQGDLKPEQRLAAEALLQHDTGTLSASTAFGKTVIAAYLIAERKVNTLVIVHRRQLLDQWIKTLARFLGLAPDDIGHVGGGKSNPTGMIDVAMVQSLSKKGQVDDLIANYGFVIVDECHHISAVSFEQVIRQSKARYVTGLSATVTRKDGHHPIIFMQAGPIRFKVSDRKQAEARPFAHKVIVRHTDFHLPEHMKMEEHPPHISEVYALLAADEQRNRLIIDDVVNAVKAGRSPVLLSERREHLETFSGLLDPLVKNVIVMKGGMGKKQRQQLMDRLAEIPRDEERVIIATGRYLGEGFDDPRLDTLFLALPVSWRGTLAQYAGRLHRLDVDKEKVLIYDYVDAEVHMLSRMFTRRRVGYKRIGYQISTCQI
ncbi:MAG: DEAD/DEAH box helicase, partial [Anaerolineaceae bacterium]|nr:DEAD/DEAH box helicase [Anaerolineaceae bacterium]